jgi:hypothetical protein
MENNNEDDKYDEFVHCEYFFLANQLEETTMDEMNEEKR